MSEPIAKFPSGVWLIEGCKTIFAFRFNAQSRKASACPPADPEILYKDWLRAYPPGQGYGAWTPVHVDRVDGFSLFGYYRTKRGGRTIDDGHLQAHLEKDGTLRLKIQEGVNREYHQYDGDYEYRTLKPNMLHAGRDFLVRLKKAPSVSAGGKITDQIKGAAGLALGQLVVRDLGAAWQWHYDFHGTSTGIKAGASVPGRTCWCRVHLQTPLPGSQWKGTELIVPSASAGPIASRTEMLVTFPGPAVQTRHLSFGTSWINLLDWEVGADLTVATLSSPTADQPYFSEVHDGVCD